ncbi:MAG: hypothetical protein LUD17_16230 [Bacteroidales bacterium]|nr:hypothetical protein [Bacteroidales bacterium]
MKLTARHILWNVMFGLAGIMSACSSHDEPQGGSAADSGLVHISLSLAVPASATSRAYDDPLDYDTELQRTIDPDDVYVIFYDTAGKIVEIPELSKIDNNASSLVTVGGDVKIRTDAIKFRVLANVEQGGNFGSTTSAVMTALKSYVGKTDTELCNALTITGFSNGKWTVEKGHYLPMQSAMSSAIYLTTDLRMSVDMYRSVAKIGVVYDPTLYDAEGNPITDNNGNAQVLEGYNLVGVRVINQNSTGAFISTYQPSADVYTQYTQPFILYGTQSIGSAVEYEVTNNATLEQIFVPEHKNDGSASDIRLQVGFTEVGKAETQWYDVYFTVDPLDNTTEVYDVVRNHSYIFKIRRQASALVVDLQPYTVVELDPDFGLERDEDGNLVTRVHIDNRYIYSTENEAGTNQIIRIEYLDENNKVYEIWKFSYVFADLIDENYDHIEIFKYQYDSAGDEVLFELVKYAYWGWDFENHKMKKGSLTSIWEYDNAGARTTRGFRFLYADDAYTTLSQMVVTSYNYYESEAIKSLTQSIYTTGIQTVMDAADRTARDEALALLSYDSTYTQKYDEETGEILPD